MDVGQPLLEKGMNPIIHSESYSGSLFLVATPLGNLEDMSIRAVNTLKQVDLIAAEDTRRSGILLSHYGIGTRMISCHEHNEEQRTGYILGMLEKGKDVALISDAGTPCVSDPGFHLVRCVREKQIPVIPIPGPCAAIAALSASGLPTDQFLFLGFLSKKQTHRRKTLEGLVGQTATMVFYESAKRIPSLVEDALLLLGDAPACLARELTKIHEEFIRGTLSEILECLASRDTLKGECVLLIQGARSNAGPVSDHELDRLIQWYLTREDASFHTASLAKDVSRQLGISRKKVYNRIVRLQEAISDTQKGIS